MSHRDIDSQRFLIAQSEQIPGLQDTVADDSFRMSALFAKEMSRNEHNLQNSPDSACQRPGD